MCFLVRTTKTKRLRDLETNFFLNDGEIPAKPTTVRVVAGGTDA